MSPAKSPRNPCISTATSVAAESHFLSAFTALIPFLYPCPLNGEVLTGRNVIQNRVAIRFPKTGIAITPYCEIIICWSRGRTSNPLLLHNHSTSIRTRHQFWLYNHLILPLWSFDEICCNVLILKLPRGLKSTVLVAPSSVLAVYTLRLIACLLYSAPNWKFGTN